MKRPSQHIEWLSLIEVSGPFLAVGLLEKAFPQGLEAVETPRRQKLRAAYDEWCEAVDEDDAQLLALHREWVQLVLADILEYSQEVLFENSASEEPLEYRDPEHGVAFAPSLVVRSDGDTKPRLLISVYPPGTDLEKVKTNDGWPVSLMERMVLLCRSTDVRLGLLTNGDRWMLVNAPVGATSSHASWYARLWFQEPLTLKAFQSLLGIRRFFGPKDETLDSLLEKSLEYQEEVTDTLGAQVRRAVEVLVQCLDKADQDRNRELLRDVSPSELYEAGLTVMMRLVFVLCAEERGLLLLGDQVYDQCYAVSTLRGHLGEDADRHGPEVLERRHDAWTRLLSVFRAVYGGIEHESLRLPAMGGSLFDPDRFPFLEGRLKGTRWRETPAAPLPIDNRTVLLLLEALQVLEQPGGALLLSYRALDVEQIGHVYEGLLEHTVARVPKITVGLTGSKKAKNPNLPLADLESARMDGEAALLTILLEATERSEPALHKDLKREVDTENFGRLLLVCGGDVDLAERIRPFSNLLRTDAWGEPIVYRANSFMVTLGADRRETGTHYTPKSLTESVVLIALDPIAYIGPAEGTTREKWRLKSSSELLDLKICDPAMGSGAFLVQACRWLGERVVEAWAYEEASGRVVTIDGEVLESLGAADPMPTQVEERLIMARRLVAERCLYGVDINPLAVELAKLSIWLVTLAKGRPFGFLDHNLRHGDSLLGINRMDQITSLSMNPDGKSHVLPLFEALVREPVLAAIELRKTLRAISIRDIRDVDAMARMDMDARESIRAPELVASAIVGEALLSSGNVITLDSALTRLSTIAMDFLGGSEIAGNSLSNVTRKALGVDISSGKPLRTPFHWPLQFPEVFLRDNPGFDALIGNPPFIYGKNISRQLGIKYNSYLGQITPGSTKNVDLSAHFLFRTYSLTRMAGIFGLICTSSISEGETRVAGLQQVLALEGTIIAAVVRHKWPGSANVLVTPCWIFRGPWKGTRLLNGEHVSLISSYLTEVGEDWSPRPLVANKGLATRGIVPNGMGFILSPAAAQSFFEQDDKYREVIMPYLIGKDLNSAPDQCPKRFIINFWDWPIQKAQQYPLVFRVVEELVKPYRQNEIDEAKKHVRERWWQYEASAKETFASLGTSRFLKSKSVRRDRLHRAIAIARVSKTGAFTFVDSGSVFAEVTVFASDSPVLLGILQSAIHLSFAWDRAGKMKNDLRYSPSLCFVPFPLPDIASFDGMFESTVLRFCEQRSGYMAGNNIGLTDFYKVYHDPRHDEDAMKEMRCVQSSIDQMVAAGYGWTDLHFEHDFYRVPYLPKNDCLRFTISESSRHEVLKQLLLLNRRRYEEEVRQGLQEARGMRETHDED